MKFIKKNREMVIFIIIVAFFIISLILDHQFLSLIESLRCPALNIFFEKIILFENNIFIYYTSILITTIFILILTKRKKQIPSYIISLAVLGILTLTLKFLVARPRPNNSTVHSFPSGHTVATFASVSFFNKLKTLQIFWFILSCMFALTRVWFSMHYLSDIVAGAAIGYYVPTIIQKMIEKHYKIKCKQAK